jgi:hypothetical protein
MNNHFFPANPSANPHMLEGFYPDPSPHVWSDGRIYLYGSRDESRDYYCSDRYHVISSGDMTHWTDHGVAFTMSETPPGSGKLLYAPDCAFKNGKYYLYYCTDNGSLGVAISDSPTGPFTHGQNIKGLPEHPGIDPAVFIDDDGQAYLYWGQFDQVRAARLRPNMTEVDESTIMQPLTRAAHFFHEGSWMSKRNGIYYFVYADESRNMSPTSIGYATGPTPLGPFTYRGVIIDNHGCDPGTWNNHGGIAEFKGRWYVFYHRSIQNGKTPRLVCAEPITFTGDGLIPEVKMTSQGAGEPLDVTTQTPASTACRLSGKVLIEHKDGVFYLDQISDGDTAVYRGIRFDGQPGKFSAKCSVPRSGGSIEARLDDPKSAPVAIVNLDAARKTSGDETSSAPLLSTVPQTGIHDLYLTFNCSEPMSLHWFQFTAMS